MIAHSYFVLQNIICCCCCSGHHRGSSRRVGEVDVRGEGERAEQAEHRRGHEDSRLVLSTLRRDSGSKIFASNMLNTLSHWSNTDKLVNLVKFLPTQWKSDSLHFFPSRWFRKWSGADDVFRTRSPPRPQQLELLPGDNLVQGWYILNINFSTLRNT